MFTSSSPRHAQRILLLAGLVTAVLLLLKPISDNDFFWHLKTGEWIYLNRALPTEDTFSFTAQPITTAFQKFILGQYWLSQLLFYLAYAAGGFPGVILLRALLFAALCVLLYRRAHGETVFFLGLMIVSLIVFLQQYPLERPQAFSFLFFAVVVYVLEGYVRGTDDRAARRVLVLLPLAMLVWANMHGLYVAGVAVILAYILTEGAKFIHPSFRPMTGRRYAFLVAGGLAGIAASFANPNGGAVFGALSLNLSHAVQTANIEYQTMLERLVEDREYLVSVDFLIMGMAVTGVALRGLTGDVTETALIAALGCLSYMHIRLFPFFLIFALPVIGRNLSFRRLTPWITTGAIILALAMSVAVMVRERDNVRNTAEGRFVDETSFPVQAAEFISKEGLQGHMYNYFDWGGYLLWRLAPERKVFIDGRNVFMFPAVYRDSWSIDRAEGGRGVPLWKSLLDHYAINYVVIPRYVFPIGALPLAGALLSDPGWVPIYADRIAVIFIRNIPDNRLLIERLAIRR